MRNGYLTFDDWLTIFLVTIPLIIILFLTGTFWLFILAFLLTIGLILYAFHFCLNVKEEGKIINFSRNKLIVKEGYVGIKIRINDGLEKWEAITEEDFQKLKDFNNNLDKEKILGMGVTIKYTRNGHNLLFHFSE